MSTSDVLDHVFKPSFIFSSFLSDSGVYKKEKINCCYLLDKNFHVVLPLRFLQFKCMGVCFGVPHFCAALIMGI